MRNLYQDFLRIFIESVCEFYLPRELEIAIQFMGSLPLPVSFFSADRPSLLRVSAVSRI